MMEELHKISQEAGDLILKYYGDKTFSVKEDLSPITLADQASHNFLVNALKQIKDIPILSEENIIPYDIRKTWDEFWLIDPLDGTKEFINGIDEFCICIALIKNRKPVMGAIYAPALKEFYWARQDKGVQYKGPKREKRNGKGVIAVTSRFHVSQKTKDFLEAIKIDNVIQMGSALKFGRMALGEIDLYPRFEWSKEWDIASGHIILELCDSSIVDMKTRTSLLYNSESLQNNNFFAHTCNINVEILNIQGALL